MNILKKTINQMSRDALQKSRGLEFGAKQERVFILIFYAQGELGFAVIEVKLSRFIRKQ